MPLPLDMQYDSINCQVATDFLLLQKIKSKYFIYLTPMYRYLSFGIYNTNLMKIS